MAIKVHGNPHSPAAQRVIVCLEEKGLEYDTVLIDLRSREQKKEPFISINPFGQVPGFEDGDLKLYESRAITKYIAHVYADKGTPLLLEGPKKLGTLYLWLEVEVQKFDASAQKIAYEILVKPVKGMTTDEAAVEQLIVQLSDVLDVYEARLAESKYLTGDSFTLADLHHLPVINNLYKTKVKSLFDARPHFSAWCADILARPAWKKALEAKY
ncbi:glutathione S-transferase-like [Henckelia pumila]|uniref:glutathione S-transferase-like n=1 Tax=Henckelia pumila TaxID=405737 RepID=UPI003C6E9488